MEKKLPVIAVLIGLTLGLVAATPADAAACDTDVVPAATLLFPYFEVDLDNPTARTTLLAVTNRDSQPTLVNFVLWTDWAVPTLSFQVYLTGYDIVTVNLRDVFVQGRLPVTGKAVSPHHGLSGEPVSFPGCNDSKAPGQAPVYSVPALTREEVAKLQGQHTGACMDNFRWSRVFNGQVARGYVTVDVVNRCSGLTPADEGYFDAGGLGVASNRNVLTGDYFLVDESVAQGEPAVHIEAYPEKFAPGDYTFYKRYVGGTAADAREPLGTQYSFRHLVGGAFDGSTRVIVWRDTGSADSAPVEGCGKPSWSGPGGLEAFYAFFDEEGAAIGTQDSCDTLPPCPHPFGSATQYITLSGDLPIGFDLSNLQFGRGMTYLVLRRAHRPDPADWQVLQGWVTVISSAQDRFSVGLRATRLDSACDPGPIKPSPDAF